MSTRILLAVAAFLMTWTEYVQADVVYLKDGSHLEGVILEETDSYVVIEFRVASIVGQKRIERADIVSIARDTEERNKETSQPTETTDTQTVDQGAKGGDAEAAWSGVTAVAFRIEGVVGRDVKPYEIALYTRLIRKHGISDVIIEIDSPGGEIGAQMSIAKTIAELAANGRVIAYCHDALSAASFLALCCDERYVSSTGRIGAAVMIATSPSGSVRAVGGNPLDEKFLGAWRASEINLLQQVDGGRNVAVWRAFTDLPTELWWSRASGFANEAPSTREGWVCLDRDTTVLCLSAADAVSVGLARQIAASLDEVGNLAFGAEATVTRLEELAKSELTEASEQIEIAGQAVRGFWDDYFAILTGIELARARFHTDQFTEKDDDFVKDQRRTALAAIRSADERVRLLRRCDRSLAKLLDGSIVGPDLTCLEKSLGDLEDARASLATGSTQIAFNRAWESCKNTFDTFIDCSQ